MKKAHLIKNKPSFLLISSILIFFFCLAPLSVFAQDTESIATLRQMGKAFAEIAEKASPAVVSVRAEKVYTQPYYIMPDWPFGNDSDPFGDDFFDRFFRRQSPQSRQRQQNREIIRPVQGSGFIISEDGYILTNDHLVGETKKVFVKMGEEAEIEAKVIGTDPDSDIAVIKIDKKNLSFLELADSDALEVGEWVLAIGNPFGLSHTVTAGIVSAKGRSDVGLTTYEDFIQTDAAINPGNSGGPLINLDGKVIGINSAIISRSGGNMGIGFAIPINMAKSVYKQLINEGKVTRGYLGVVIQDLNPEMADSLGLKDAKGAIIPEVKEGSAADKAGIKPGDVVVELEGKPIDGRHDLSNKIAAIKPGTKVEIMVLRDGERKTLTAELEERTREEETTAAAKEPDSLEKLGLSVQDLTNNIAEQLGYEGLSGVIITNVEPGSVAERRKLEAGMLIMQVGQKKIRDVEDFKEQLKKGEKGHNVLLLVRSQSRTFYATLPVPED
jgi:serine protease Do